MPWFRQKAESTLLFTAKGYPDHASRAFVGNVLASIHKNKLSVKCIYLGDSDPHGVDIYLQYVANQSLLGLLE